MSAHSWDFLEYRNRWLRHLEGEMLGSDECASDPIVFDPPEALQTIIYQWDLPTFTRLASCVFKGAQLSYPDDYIQVTWDFLRGVDCPMQICELMIECIQNDEDVRNALSGILGSRANPPGNPMTSLQKGENLAGETNPTCNKAVLSGQCSQVLAYTNQLIVDVLEKIEVTSNIVELVDAASEFPIVGWLKDLSGAQTALALIQYYQNAIAEEYNAQYTQALADEIANEIYCACRDDCEVTIERIFEVYAARLATYITVPTIADLIDLIEFVVGVSQDASFVVELAHFFAWGSAALGNFFFGGRFNGFLKEAIEGSGANNNYVDALCETAWEHTFDFTSGTEGWTAALATYSAGVGWVQTGSGGAPYTVDIYIDPSWGGSNLQSITLLFSSTTASAGAFRGVYYPGTGFAAQTFPPTDTGDYEQIIVPNNNTPPRIEVQNSNVSADAGFNAIRGIILSGEGVDPF